MNQNQKQAVQAYNRLLLRTVAAVQKLLSDQSLALRNGAARLQAVGLQAKDIPTAYAPTLERATGLILGMMYPEAMDEE
jgi:hypothetical protein